MKGWWKLFLVVHNVEHAVALKLDSSFVGMEPASDQATDDVSQNLPSTVAVEGYRLVQNQPSAEDEPIWAWRAGSMCIEMSELSAQYWIKLHKCIMHNDLGSLKLHMHGKDSSEFVSLTNHPKNANTRAAARKWSYTPLEVAAMRGHCSIVTYLYEFYKPPATVVREALVEILRHWGVADQLETFKYLVSLLTGEELSVPILGGRFEFDEIFDGSVLEFALRLGSDPASSSPLRSNHIDFLIEIVECLVGRMSGEQIRHWGSEGPAGRQDAIQILTEQVQLQDGIWEMHTQKAVRLLDIITAKMCPDQVDRRGFDDGDDFDFFYGTDLLAFDSIFDWSLWWLLQFGRSELFEILLPRSSTRVIKRSFDNAESDDALLIGHAVFPGQLNCDRTTAQLLFAAMSRALHQDSRMSATSILLMFKLILYIFTEEERTQNVPHVNKIIRCNQKLRVELLRQQRRLIIDRLCRHPNFNLGIGMDVFSELFADGGFVSFTEDRTRHHEDVPEEDVVIYLDPFTRLEVMKSLMEAEMRHCRTLSNIRLARKFNTNSKTLFPRLSNEVWRRVLAYISQMVQDAFAGETQNLLLTLQRLALHHGEAINQYQQHLGTEEFRDFFEAAHYQIFDTKLRALIKSIA